MNPGPAWLALIWPTLRPQLEKMLESHPANDAAAALLPHVKQLVDPKYHRRLSLLLAELAVQLHGTPIGTLRREK